jgi:hypothetical protein
LAGCVLFTLFKPYYTLTSLAQTETLLGSSQAHKAVCEVLLHLHVVLFKLSNKIVLEALVSCKLCSVEVFDTGLALDHDFRTLSLDMLEQLRSGHVLEILVIANIAAKLGALVHRVFLQLAHCFPDNHSMLFVFVALVGELAEVDAVL